MAELRETVWQEVVGQLEAEKMAQVDDGKVAVIRWFAVVDVVEPDGERKLITITSDGMTEWEYSGLCEEFESPFEKLPLDDA